MQKREIIAHFFVPADQHAPEAIHPAMRPLHAPPAGFESRLPFERLGLFPPRPDVGGEAKLGQQAAYLIIVIVFVQTHPPWGVWGRLRPCDRKTLDGVPSHLESMAIRPLYGEADRHATAFSEHAALGADLPRLVGFLPTFFPPKGRFGHSPIHREPFPVNPLEGIVRHQVLLPQRQEDACRCPRLEMAMGGTGEL
jgi:hypothetical protein